MTRGMAVDIHRAGQRSNVAGRFVDMYRQRRGAPTETPGTDAQTVDFFENFFFHFPEYRISVFGVDISEQRFFGQIRRSFKITADPYADDNGRTGIGAGVAYRLHNEINDPLSSRGRSEHFQRAHIFRTTAFGRNGQTDLIAIHEADMKNGRSIVAVILTGQRCTGGFPQKTFFIAFI